MKLAIKLWAMLGLVFLALPLFVIIPRSFTSGQYLFYTPEMLALDPNAYSTRWYVEVLGDREWMLALPTGR